MQEGLPRHLPGDAVSLPEPTSQLPERHPNIVAAVEAVGTPAPTRAVAPRPAGKAVHRICPCMHALSDCSHSLFLTAGTLSASADLGD